MNTIYRFVLTVALLLATFIAAAQQQNTITVATLSPGTPNSVLAGRYVVPNLVLINSAASVATVKLYDKATATTNTVQAAYSTIGSYTTNYPFVFTNQFGLVDTNYITGTYNYATSVAASTNEATRISTLAIPASGTVNVDINYVSTLGLVLLADTNVTAQITYRRNP